MSVLVRASLLSGFEQVRYEPIAKRIRAELGGATVVDTTRAALLWEPRRVVPSYAVPAEDVRAQLVPAAAVVTGGAREAGAPMPGVSTRPVLDPRVPFDVHTAEGEVADVVAGEERRERAALHLSDPDLAGYVVLDFNAFDAWYEEDERNQGHPRDPFHRIDVLASSREIRIERDGEVLAESSRPMLLFETLLPTRYYLRRQDVRTDLVPSERRTRCAYKGEASYWSVTIGGRLHRDVAWTYEQPSHEASQVAGLVAFFNERIDIVLDGERQERPVTPWS